jgi:hypothetical protein
MNGRCSNAECGVRDGLTCELGHIHFQQCTHFTAEPNGAGRGSSKTDEKEGSHRLPWTGRSFGLGDVILASARSSPLLVGLIGPFNTGKTAFLTSMYAYFCQSGIVGEYSFAGSYTLSAWEHLKGYGHWPNNSGPNFPPHTSDSGERVPSLLHLALRTQDDVIRDILFTDVPGEWFSRWIKDQTSDNTAGARWIADNSSHFLFFVDRSALATPSSELGILRHQTILLARLLSERRGTRPVIGVWTKSDGDVSVEMEASVRMGIARHLGEHLSFDVSVRDGSCLSVLEHILRGADSEAIRPVESAIAGTSTFLNYEGGTL